MEERILDWTEVIPHLNEAEEEEVAMHLSIPSVQKYFRALAIKELVDQAKVPVVDILNNQLGHIAGVAYSKGRLSVSDEIVRWAITRQKSRQLPPK